MDYGFDPVSVQRADNRVAIHQIGCNECGFRHCGGFVAFAEIVVYDGFVTMFDQLLDDHAADVTSPAGDQNLHELRYLLN
jgi:hypothetical protein